MDLLWVMIMWYSRQKITDLFSIIYRYMYLYGGGRLSSKVVSLSMTVYCAHLNVHVPN